MSAIEHCEFLVPGSGESGKYPAWTMAKSGRRAVVVERRRPDAVHLKNYAASGAEVVIGEGRFVAPKSARRKWRCAPDPNCNRRSPIWRSDSGIRAT